MGNGFEEIVNKVIKQYVEQEAEKEIERTMLLFKRELYGLKNALVPKIVNGIRVVTEAEGMDGKYTIHIIVNPDKEHE